MENITEPENNVSVKKSSKKFLVKGLFILGSFFLVFLLLLLNRGRFFKVGVDDISQDKTQQNDASSESSFEELVSSTYTEEDKEYLEKYSYYYLGYVGDTFLFDSFEEKDMSISISKVSSGEVESYFLTSDFVVLCSKFDPTKYGIDFSGVSDKEKIIISEKTVNMPNEKKIQLLSNYPKGGGLSVIYDQYEDITDLSIIRVKKILLFFPDLEVCY